MPVARNVTPQGSFDSGAAYGDYLAGGLGGEWQVFESAPYIAAISNNACILDFSLGSSWIVKLVASTATSISMINVPTGVPQRIITQQPSSGYGTITFVTPAIRWSGGTAGQATATSSAVDVFVIFSPLPTLVLAGAAMPNC